MLVPALCTYYMFAKPAQPAQLAILKWLPAFAWLSVIVKRGLKIEQNQRLCMETTGHMTIFKLIYQPDLQAISTRATEDQIGMALLSRASIT